MIFCSSICVSIYIPFYLFMYLSNELSIVNIDRGGGDSEPQSVDILFSIYRGCILMFWRKDFFFVFYSLFSIFCFSIYVSF